MYNNEIGKENESIHIVPIDKEQMNNRATLTGRCVYGKSESEGYRPEELQLFFVVKDSYNEAVIGLIDVLKCLRFAEKQGVLPPIADEWWQDACERYEFELI